MDVYGYQASSDEGLPQKCIIFIYWCSGRYVPIFIFPTFLRHLVGFCSNLNFFFFYNRFCMQCMVAATS